MRNTSDRGLFWLTYFVGLALLAGFAVGIATAGDVSLTWTQPTTNTDNSAIPTTGAGSISSNRVEWGSCVGTAFGVKAGEKVVNPASVSTVVTGLAPATHCFRVFVANTYGNESGASNVASKALPTPTPNPPTGLAAVGGIAYTILKRENRFVMLPVGTIPADTQCDTSQSVNGYYVVPNAAVTWSGTVRPIVVVAACT